ncbi:MAG: ATP-dependent RNA helicase HrpA [Halioglobus sp.]|nr:ATP-dependent RNA helicase HrpA [Halioglobus sp.]
MELPSGADARKRDGSSPPAHFPSELPITACRERIAQLIEQHQVLIVAGETGSGKTTQLPKICLEMGRGVKKRIGHTQPRRLAARAVAARIASELGSSLGERVGYQVRFSDRLADATAIKLMTDGILLAELQRDRLLDCYDTLIIDEAHERSLNIDFLLGYLKRILPQRPDLKLIVTSATIDVDSFSRHFGDAPVIEIPGRSFPVETIYLPAEDAAATLETHIVSLVKDIDAGRFGPRGDILVFLPGEREIRELAHVLRLETAVDVLPLYARLGHSEQRRVFDARRGGRGIRAVLATNVAETSLTVPGIRYVIDPGQARISRYSHRSKMQRLPVEAISRASADQRRGRCGRIAPGVCIRLYAETDYARRPAFTDPEIQRTNLAAVILRMQLLRLGDVAHFPFVDAPDARMVRDGYTLLQELGAITADGGLTRLGSRMARLPVDPRLARMILESESRGCLEEVLIVSSALAAQDPRERPADRRQQADAMHARFHHPRSDFLARLNLWRYFEELRQSLSQNQLRKRCQREFLSFLRMREWRDIHTQLRVACRQQDVKGGRSLGEETDYEAIHTALLAGLLGNIARHQEGREYLGTRQRKLKIYPSSSQTRRSPKWLVAAEIVETSQVFAREVAAIDPTWAVMINPELLKVHHYQPRWHPRRGQVVAFKRINLYGLTLVDKRVVHYGPIAPIESRILMIREGLIPGRLRRQPKFLQHNRTLVLALENLEARTRRRDILVQEEGLFQFYDERLPSDCCTVRGLCAWLKREPAAERGLYMRREEITAHDPGAGVCQQFPDVLVWDGMRLPLSYRFEPGQVADGVSITLPVALLNRAPRHLFDWLVPGLLREKCIQLVKSLPKEKRKHIVPVPDYVDRALQHLEPDDVDLLDCLSQRLSELGGISLRRDDWSLHKLHDYYHMNIRVVDAQGSLMEQGRNLEALVKRFRNDTRQSMSADKRQSPAREGILRWDLGDLPSEWRFRQAHSEIVTYPALVDRGDAVAIELYDYPNTAQISHRLGVLRLLRIGGVQQVRYLRKQLLRGNEHSLLLAGAGFDRSQRLEDLVDAAYLQTVLSGAKLPRTESDFRRLEKLGRERVIQRAHALEEILCRIMGPLIEVRQKLNACTAGPWSDSVNDINMQLSALFGNSFLRDTPSEWIDQYPRYMVALKNRLARLTGQYRKDQKNTGLLAELTRPLRILLQQREGLLALSEEAQTYRWMLEEFRVSLFAQNLGTQRAVSPKRLLEQWQLVEAWLEKNPR